MIIIQYLYVFSIWESCKSSLIDKILDSQKRMIKRKFVTDVVSKLCSLGGVFCIWSYFCHNFKEVYGTLNFGHMDRFPDHIYISSKPLAWNPEWIKNIYTYISQNGPKDTLNWLIFGQSSYRTISYITLNNLLQNYK